MHFPLESIETHSWEHLSIYRGVGGRKLGSGRIPHANYRRYRSLCSFLNGRTSFTAGIWSLDYFERDFNGHSHTPPADYDERRTNLYRHPIPANLCSYPPLQVSSHCKLPAAFQVPRQRRQKSIYDRTKCYERPMRNESLHWRKAI